MEATSNPTLKNFFHPVTQYLLQNHKKCRIIFCPTHQHEDRFLPGWISLLLGYGQSCLPKLLPIIFPSTKIQLWLFFYHSFIQGQSFCVSLCLQLQPGRPRGRTTLLPPFKIHYVTHYVFHTKSSPNPSPAWHLQIQRPWWYSSNSSQNLCSWTCPYS